MGVFIFSTTFSKKFLILRKDEEDVINKMYRSSGKVPIIHSSIKFH